MQKAMFLPMNKKMIGIWVNWKRLLETLASMIRLQFSFPIWDRSMLHLHFFPQRRHRKMLVGIFEKITTRQIETY